MAVSHHLRRMASKSLPWNRQRTLLSKLAKWRQAAAQAVQDNFFIPVIVRICKKAREPLTNLFEWLQKGTPVRYIDGDERPPSRLVMPVWSKADEVAAELEELTKSEVWMDELGICGREGRTDLASERIHHEPHAPPPRRLRCAFLAETHQAVASATHDDLQVGASCQMPSARSTTCILCWMMKLSWNTTLKFRSHVPHRTPGSGFGARRAWMAHIWGYNLYNV